MGTVIRVTVDDGNLEGALRQFKKAVERLGLMRELRSRTRYVKPSERRKQKSKNAWKRAKKQARREAAARERRSAVVSAPQRRGRGLA